jgi:SAM-dependent methyltransferase
MSAIVRVVFVGGYARCGSTLLDRLLGQIEGFGSFGELRHIWYRSFIDNELCSCGHPFHECPFWLEVVQEAFGGFKRVDAEAIDRNKGRVDSYANIPRILTGGWTRSYRRRMGTYAEALAALYTAIQKVSGVKYIVDSTKDPQHAYILHSIPGFDVRVVHLVRDSRAVAFSWRRVRDRPEIHWERREMPRYPVARTAVAWSLTNLGVEASRRLELPYALVRYEDLVREPRSELSRILDSLDLGPVDLGFLGSGKATLSPSHSPSGNPMRFQTGDLPIRLDDEWLTRMRPIDRKLVTGITIGLLYRYGYLGRSVGKGKSGESRMPKVPVLPPTAQEAPGGSGIRAAPSRLSSGPNPIEMWRVFRLAIAHRREPLAFGRASSGLVIRYLRSRGVPLTDRRWLDVGVGGGAIPEALDAAGASVVGLDIEDRRVKGINLTAFVLGRGERLPFGDAVFDGVLCSNVLEHVADTWGVIGELLRVCRPGGVVYLSWTNWYSPFGGHDWSPFHYAGPRLGPRLYRVIRQRNPRLVPGQTLFPVHVGGVLRGLRMSDIEFLDVAPRYWPSLRFLARIPGLREVALWNCVVLTRKCQ